MKKILSIILIAVLTFCVVGCGNITISTEGNTETEAEVEEAAEEGNGDELPVLTFGFWGTEETLETYKMGLEGVEEAVGCKVEFNQYADNNTFWEKLPSEIAAGTAPDFVIATNENYTEYIKNGYFVPFDKELADTADLVPNAVDIFTVDGDLYGIPTTCQFGMFAVNLDLWEAAGLDPEALPKTWDDVKAACEVLTTDDVYGLCFNPDGSYHTTMLAQSFGGGWGAGATVNSAENAEAIDWAIDMLNSGLACTPSQVGLSWEGDVFVQGKCAMTTAGVWYVGSMNSGAPDTNYALIPVPQKDAENPKWPAHATAIFLINGCKDVELATKVANYFNSEAFQRTQITVQGQIPSRTALRSEFFELTPQAVNLQDAENYVVKFDYPDNTAEFQNALALGLEEAIYDTESGLTGQSILDDVVNQLGY